MRCDAIVDSFPSAGKRKRIKICKKSFIILIRFPEPQKTQRKGKKASRAPSNRERGSQRCQLSFAIQPRMNSSHANGLWKKNWKRQHNEPKKEIANRLLRLLFVQKLIFLSPARFNVDFTVLFLLCSVRRVHGRLFIFKWNYLFILMLLHVVFQASASLYTCMHLHTH